MAICVFVLTVILFFWDVVVGPNFLLDANPYHYEPWKAYASGEDLSGRTYRVDALTAYLPRRVELARAVEDGRFPLWNPYIYGGMPFFADPQTRVLYPIELMLLAFEPQKAMGIDVAVHMFISMLGMYLFLCSLGANLPSRMLAAFAYAFSSFFYVRIGHPTFIASASWVPFFFFGFETARRSEHRGTLMLIGFLSMGYLAGFPQIFAFGVGGLVVYALWLSLAQPHGQRTASLKKTARILGISGGLSALILGVQLVPFMELVSNSSGLGFAYEAMRDLYLAPPILLLRSFSPSLYGNPVNGTDWSGFLRLGTSPYTPDFAIYCGVGALMLGIGGVVLLRRSARHRVLYTLLAFSIAVATSPLVLKIVYSVLPVFHVTRVSRISVLGCFSLSAIAAMTFTHVTRGLDPKATRGFAMAVASVLLGTILLTVVLLIWGDWIVERVSMKVRALSEDQWLRTIISTRSGMIKEWVSRNLGEWSVNVKSQMIKPVLFALGGCGLLLAIAFRRGAGRRVFGILVAAFVVLGAFDIISTARGYYVSQPGGLFCEGTGICLLQELAGESGRWRIQCQRFTSEDVRALPPNTQQLYGLQCSHGRSTIVPGSFSDLYDALSTSAPRLSRFEAHTPMPPLELLVTEFTNVRYLVTSGARTPYVTSPFFRALAAAGGETVPIRIVGPNGDARLGLEQGAGQALGFQLEAPVLRALDFAVSFTSDAKSPGDSVYFWLTWESGEGRATFVRGLDLYGDRLKWHESVLDLSGAGRGLTTIRMGLGISPGVEGKEINGAWSGFDLVKSRCELRRIESGYEIYLDDGADFVSVLLRPTAKEVPLDIGLGNGLANRRWVAFPPHLAARRIGVDVRGRSGESITIESDSLLVLGDAKAVHMGTSYPDIQLIWDRDMHIYENFAAIPRCLCIGWEGLETDVVGGKEVIGLSHIGCLSNIDCGDCRTVSYHPERIILETSSTVDCCLLVLDNDYPGWTAEVDGSEAEIISTDIGMRAIKLRAGQHDVVLVYKPISLVLGIILTSLGAVLTCVYAWYTRGRVSTSA